MHSVDDYALRWEELRADWVNGNRQDVLKAIMDESKRDLLMIIRAALLVHHENRGMDGTLVDLVEMLNSYWRLVQK